MKGILFLSLFFLISCSNNKSKDTATEPVTVPTVTPKTDTPITKVEDSSLIIHPNADMVRVVYDINGHIHNIRKTKNIDVDFIEIMKVYNQAIMEMAYMEWTNGKNATLKNWASDILNNKKTENIALSKMKDRINSSVKHNDSFYQDIEKFLQDSLYLPPTSTLSVDKQFAVLLPPHHWRAIEAGKLYLRHTNNPELRGFTENWIKEYGQEVEKIKPIDKELKK